MSGSQLVYTDADFRAQFPYFANVVQYPAAQLSMYFTMGTTFIDNNNSGYLSGFNLQTALYLMTAHLQQIATNTVANNGTAGGVVTDATIDKVRIAIQPPLAKNAWQQWLQQTPWGQQLLALLTALSAGGFFASGRFEVPAFRRAYGRFA